MHLFFKTLQYISSSRIISQPLELRAFLSTRLFRQPSEIASPVTLYAATHTDLIVSSASAYTDLNHTDPAVLSPALHVLKHNAVWGFELPTCGMVIGALNDGANDANEAASYINY